MLCMCSHHEPQQIVNERPIRSHGSVFGPRHLNVLGFDYERMFLVYILFVGTQDSQFTSILPELVEGKLVVGPLY